MFNIPPFSSSRESKLLEQLRENPQLFERFESILALAREDNSTDVRSADEVEFALIEQLRQLGNETLTHWAVSAEEKVSEKLKASHTGPIQQREKKRSSGGAHMDSLKLKNACGAATPKATFECCLKR